MLIPTKRYGRPSRVSVVPSRVTNGDVERDFGGRRFPELGLSFDACLVAVLAPAVNVGGLPRVVDRVDTVTTLLLGSTPERVPCRSA